MSNGAVGPVAHRLVPTVKARVKWLENATFVGESGSGHAIVMDGPPESGGRNLGVRPMETLLIGMGGCTAFDVVSILGKSRQRVTDCVVEIEAQRAEEVPKVFTHIHVRYIVRGHNLKEAMVRRAVELSAQKYCSATIMMRKAVEISHEFEIVEEDSGG
jgi:putative redox protein